MGFQRGAWDWGCGCVDGWVGGRPENVGENEGGTGDLWGSGGAGDLWVFGRVGWEL